MNKKMLELTIFLLCVIFMFMFLCGCVKNNKDGYISYSSIDKNLSSKNFKVYIMLDEKMEYTSSIAGFSVMNEFGIKFMDGYLYSITIFDDNEKILKTVDLDFRESTPENLTNKLSDMDIRIIIIVIFAIQFIIFGTFYFIKKYKKMKLNKKEKNEIY